MSPAAIEIKGLTKSYGDVLALNGVDIQIKRGEFYGLLGPNGAGKTTTINILTGLVFRDKGSTKVFGKDTIRDFRFTRSKIGIAAQEFSVDWFFPIEKLLLFQAGYYGIKKHDAMPMVNVLLERLGLSKKRNSRLRQLSGGMKRRFQIAKALVHNPDIIILDEPTAGVDVELRRDLWQYLRDLHSEGKTIFSTEFVSANVVTSNLHTFLSNRMYMAKLFDWFGWRTWDTLAAICDWFDRNIIDGVINFIAYSAQQLGNIFRRSTSGFTGHYASLSIGGLGFLVVITRIVMPLMGWSL